MSIAGRLLPIGIIFLITVGFGFWVSSRGKPYPTLLFNIHKLIALGGVILASVRVFSLNPFLVFPPVVLALIAAAAICAISMFATGAVMSIKEEETRLILVIHRIGPVIITILSGLAVYLGGLIA
jgi:hypothetical protein